MLAKIKIKKASKNFKEGSILAIARGDLVHPYVSHVTCVRQSCLVAA